MLRTFLAIVLLTARTATAEPMPPMPEGLTLVEQGQCTDNKTGEKGYCMFWADPDGTAWMVFTQDEKIMFIRHILADTYEQVWTDAKFNSY